MEIRFDDRGLVPGIVQDAATGRVLMMAYLDASALEATRRTGEAHFWSRSRSELWHKGAVSGNTMAVRRIRTDCDGDALLLEVEPAGPACHTGSISCFSDDPPEQGFRGLERLWAVITDRRRRRPAGSYTAALLEEGVDGPARKVIEEAGEASFAAKDHAAGIGPPERVAEEAADLIYHLLVLLAERGVEASAVLQQLAAREAAPVPADPGPGSGDGA
jgi:phosphoribosyl-ATP pyrophosphohydrolase/phosphoribosyl-AMP cyclohydrolase